MTGHPSLLSFPKVLEVRIGKRLNRFVVSVNSQGSMLRAHINNTGRLEQFLIPDKKAYCLESTRGGKTDCRLFAIADKVMAALIDTQLQMRAFEIALERGLLPWLKGYRFLKRNAPLGNSLIDYLLESCGSRSYLEAKSAVLREGDWAMYPDCPTQRGQKHIQELTRFVSTGGKAFILFIAALPNMEGFKPHKTADPRLYDLLREAENQRVVIKSLGLYYNPMQKSIDLYNPDLPIAV
jgi:sugar fermentation stimulation protein A